MLELVKKGSFYLEEDKNPQFREIFSDLASEQDFPIRWYNEDNSGEIEVNIHVSFVEDLEDIIENDIYPHYKEDLINLSNLVKHYDYVSCFYYK